MKSLLALGELGRPPRLRACARAFQWPDSISASLQHATVSKRNIPAPNRVPVSVSHYVPMPVKVAGAHSRLP